MPPSSRGPGKTSRRPPVLLLCLLLAGARPPALHAQDAEPLPSVSDVPAALSFFAPILFPLKVLQDEAVMRDFVMSAEFAAARRTKGDRGAVDLLFRRALGRSWNNTGEALLICLLAVLDHRTLGIRLPLVGPLLWIPLTGEFEEDFRMRLAALPSRLYADTPPGGDRDKLQHFFGSALLTVLCESAEVSDRLGLFLEEEEEILIVGGTRDERDVRANRQGQRFGLALMTNLEALPSPFLAAGPDVHKEKNSP